MKTVIELSRDDHDDYGDYGDSGYNGPTPQWGFDNAVDIAEAKRRCQDMAHAPLANRQGLELIFDLAMRLHGLGIAPTTSINLIDRYCTSPLSKADVSLQVYRAYRAARTVPGVMSSARYENANKNAALFGSNPDNPWPTARGDGESWLGMMWPKPLQYQGKDNASKSAEVFLSERPDRLISSDGVLYTLDDCKVWRAITDEELAAEIRATDPTTILDVGKIYMMVKAIHLARFTKARPFEWIDRPEGAPDPSGLILARNGIFFIESGEIVPHDGRYFATALPEWDWKEDAECPLWLEKLGEWLHPSFHPTLQEFTGYLLTSDTSIEVLLAMIGAKRGGKGTITRVMQALLGKGHHASVMLNDMAGDFGLAGLIDKRAVFIPDAHDAEMSRRSAAIERIKSITGNDEVSVNRKNQAMLSLKIPAKIILVANKHPKFLDESGALADRELVLVFDTSFAKVKDTTLSHKLMAELSGIANWALDGLARLRANGNRFTVGERGRTAQRELAEAQSPALRFAKENLTVTGEVEDGVPLPVLFERYSNWATYEEEISGREKRNRTDFRTDLIAALAERGVRYDAKTVRRWKTKDDTNGTPMRRWFTGIKLREVPEAR